MKKINFFLSVILFSFIISCNKYEEIKKLDASLTTETDLTPDMKQWAFMGETTSITCGICGSSGYSNFNLIKKNYSGKIVALAFHCNTEDAMTCNNQEWSFDGSRPTGGGIPSFYIGDTKTPTSGMQPYIDTLLKRTPEAQVKFKATIEGYKMNITSKIKFFKEVTGDYYVTYFLCESGIDGSPTAPVGYVQTSGGAGYKHNNVVRAANASTAYGVKFTTSATTAINTVFDYSCSINISSNWVKSNLFITAVIWKKNPDNAATCQYLFVNGWDTQIYN
ncbi:MAG: Omp28-related outer membrane protein [Bacteroidetes bacterium]|nr:Omp28-related outer membrane protein [Bacteroidota bacterium]